MPDEVSEAEEGISDKVGRNFYFPKRDALTFGCTKGCPGCMSWSKGGPRKPHTPACRERFAKLLEGQAKFQNSQQRMREFKAKELDRQEGLKRLRDEVQHEDNIGKRKIDNEVDNGGRGVGAWLNEEDPDGRTQNQEGWGSGLKRSNEGLDNEENGLVQRRTNEVDDREEDGGKGPGTMRIGKELKGRWRIQVKKMRKLGG